jgi:hypothetical protein
MMIVWWLGGVLFIIGLTLGINYCRIKWKARRALHHEPEFTRDSDLEQLGTFVGELVEVTHKLNAFTDYMKDKSNDPHELRDAHE